MIPPSQALTHLQSLTSQLSQELAGAQVAVEAHAREHSECLEQLGLVREAIVELDAQRGVLGGQLEENQMGLKLAQSSEQRAKFNEKVSCPRLVVIEQRVGFVDIIGRRDKESSQVVLLLVIHRWIKSPLEDPRILVVKVKGLLVVP